MVLTVFLISVMTVSAFTVDATIVAQGGNQYSDTTLSCRYTLSGNAGTYDSVTTKWFKNNAEQTAYNDQKTNIADGLYTIAGPSGITQIDPFDQWHCKVTAVAGADTVEDSAVPFLIKNYAPTLDFTPLGTLSFMEDSSTSSVALMGFASDKDLTQAEKATGLTFSVVYKDASKVDCSVTSDGTLSYTPAPNYYGSAKCTLQVKDAQSYPAQADVNFNVINAPDQFTITPIADQVGKIGQLFSYEVTVTNPDKSSVSYSLLNQPAGMVISKITDEKAKITFTPAAAGAFPGITVKASTGGFDYYEDFKLTVTEKTAPTFNTISDQKVTADSKWSLNLGSFVSNVDNVPVVFSIESKAPTTLIPAQMVMSTDSAVYTNNKLEWTPTVANIGTYYFTVKAKYTLSGQETTVSRDLKLRVGKESCIVINDIDASVGTSDEEMDSDSGVNKEGGSVDVKPGEKLNINVELKNICEEEDDKDFKHTVEDINVEVTLDEIGSEDEQDKDKDYKDLDVGDKDNQDFLFTIAEDADKGTYTLTIEASGSDEDTGDFYEIDPVTIDVMVDKEDHDLNFKTFTLNPTSLSCTKNTQLTVKLVNVGDKDEDDIELVVSSDELNLEEIEFIDELQEGDADDEDSYFKKTYSINVPSSVKTGTYVITGKAYYDNDDEVETASAVLTVVPCGPSTDSEEEEEEVVVEDEEGQKDVVEIVTTAAPITSSTQTATATPVTNDDVVVQDSFFESDLYVGLLIAAIVVVLLVIIGLVVAISRR
jgi:hypothetical protein